MEALYQLVLDALDQLFLRQFEDLQGNLVVTSVDALVADEILIVPWFAANNN